MNRRQFNSLALASIAGGAVSTFAAEPSKPTPERAFTLDLRCGSIGVKANQLEAIELAHKHGFESVTPDPYFLGQAKDDQLKKLLADMKEKKIVWGSAGLPVQFRQDEAKYKSDLKALPQRCAGVKKAGGKRMGTYIMPRHDSLTYMANFRLHAKRLRECVKVMSDHGLRFGIEYVGPKTLWSSAKHSFIHLSLIHI